MERPTIVLKLKPKHFSALLALAESVGEQLNGNIHFVSPNPSLPVLMSRIAELRDAIANWGVKGNRGSHVDYVHLQGTALHMHAVLQTLARYCESTVRMNVPEGQREAALATSGFALKKQKAPQGRLEPVQNLHRFIARNIRQGDVKMRWEQPLNVSTHTNVKGYCIYRNTTNDFSTAENLDTVTATTYTDTPGAGTWFYWVAPVNYMGYGVPSHALKITTV